MGSASVVVMPDIFRVLRTAPFAVRLVDLLLAVRAVPYLGLRYVCPVCRWRLRGFTQGGASLRARDRGYCPRCNSKARHRRTWLFLEAHTDLFDRRRRLLHVSPKYSLSRRFVRMGHLFYVAGDIGRRPHIGARLDLSQLPFRDGAFDSIICIHVLEHVDDDRAAIGEMYRVLEPGGWALISVPIRLDQPTFEDPSIRDPAEREAAFGETTHVRYYGRDLEDRLARAGFDVELDLASGVPESERLRFGLLDDENIFFCRKPPTSVPE